MSTDIKIPELPESVADATIVTWHKQAGDAIRRDEILLDIETDKVVLEVPAPQDGVLDEILAPEGEVVTAGQVVGKLGADKGASKADKAAEDKAAEKSEDSAPAEAPPLSPAVRKLVAEHDLEPSAIEGSGRDGRILKEDVLRHVEQQGAAKASEKTDAPAPSTQAPAPAASTPPGQRTERRVPMTRLRARIAERLLEVQQSAAILTTFNEVNMAPVMDMRARHKEAFEKRHGVRLGFMSFFVRAATEALKRFPEVNASIDGKDVVYHGYFDIGIAVSSPRGLVVPVLRDTDGLSMAEVEKGINALGEKAKSGGLTMDDLTGGTFTISNGGVFGSLLSTPIINPPQSAILGMHTIQERPVAEK
ncbi:MAG TPA: 2-oxoglutarate dehydrogenase complex dihydrolipoyllysine-residue succinyltransferase, partial [Thioalkalivibrio sp.]|nr:2-oxoglutarate dehydrogenase complex dihydrolipoyllysine-residue succinyltransferase [Thioalkalivibrio sp.]